ncbi:MAG: hypothetical protein OHK0013_44600 [Sandaracinaceae bacterium]
MLATGCPPPSVQSADGTEAAVLIQMAYCDVLLAPDCAPGVMSFEQCNYTLLFEGEGRAVDSGRATLDVASLSACLEEMTCGAVPPACFAVFVGSRRIGERCAQDPDCSRGLHCERSEDACGGRCAAALDEGEPCARDAECGGGALFERRPGLACVQESLLSPGRCGVRTRVVAAEGEPCGTTLGSPTRVTLAECQFPAVCREGRCASEPLSAGAACRAGIDRCAEGLACGGAQCIPIVGLDEPCGASAVCRASEGLECVGEICVSMPDEPGDVCARGCANGLRCIAGLCDEPSPLGGACQSHADCAMGVCGMRGLCEPGCDA